MAVSCAFRSAQSGASVGIWIELGVFLLVFVFAAWQFHDLKREKQKRLAASEASARHGQPAPVQSTAPPATAPQEESRR